MMLIPSDEDGDELSLEEKVFRTFRQQIFKTAMADRVRGVRGARGGGRHNLDDGFPAAEILKVGPKCLTVFGKQTEQHVGKTATSRNSKVGGRVVLDPVF